MKKKQKRVKPPEMVIMIHESSASYAQCHAILQKFIDYLNTSLYKGLFDRVVYRSDHQVNASMRYGNVFKNRQKAYPERFFGTITLNASEFGGPERVRYRFMP